MLDVSCINFEFFKINHTASSLLHTKYTETKMKLTRWDNLFSPQNHWRYGKSRTELPQVNLCPFLISRSCLLLLAILFTIMEIVQQCPKIRARQNHQQHKNFQPFNKLSLALLPESKPNRAVRGVSTHTRVFIAFPIPIS